MEKGSNILNIFKEVIGFTDATATNATSQTLSSQSGSSRAKVSQKLLLLFLLLLAFSWCTAFDYSHTVQAAANSSSASQPFSNPIFPGDHPDPTIIRVGHTYWTTSTSGDWGPEFPLFRSDDLHYWTQIGSIFPSTPSWASGSFWAPELVNDGHRIVVYYAARKRDGPLCVAAATAIQPEGPYTDHGPLICQSDGSIDPSMVRDEHGQPFLVWKEDGNSIGKPTPIWVQPLTDDLLHLTGSKTQLIVNDTNTWEGSVVEAPYVLRHAGSFYLFYAGNACCGVACHYAEGVARASHLLGPWMKDPANPIIGPNAAWRCPGHGTAVETPSGSDYFLYHAYPTVGSVYLGRESVLDTIQWTPDGWPVINGGRGPGGGADQQEDLATLPPLIDNFDRDQLAPGWTWPIGRRPTWQVGGDKLILDSFADDHPAFLAQPLLTASYEASVGVQRGCDATQGLGIVGRTGREVTLSRSGNHLELWSLRGTNRTSLWQAELAPAEVVWLRINASGQHDFTYSYSFDRQHWIDAGATLDVAGLLAGDQGLRVGLVATGSAGTHACFVHFGLKATPNSIIPHSTNAMRVH